MSAMWCWLQPFGQPLIFTCILRVSGSVMPICSMRSRTARLSPIELVMPSLQESVPGHDTTSSISSAAGRPRPSSSSALPGVVDVLVAHPAQDHVLMHRRAGVAAGVVAHDLADAAELLRRQVTARHVDVQGREAGLALRRHARLHEAVEARAVAVGRRIAVGNRRARRLCSSWTNRSGVKSRSPTQSPSSSSSTSSRTASMPTLSTSTLMRARARFTRSQSWRSKIRKHGLGDLQVLAVVGGREVVQRRRDRAA